jgi:hypothetical protein
MVALLLLLIRGVLLFLVIPAGLVWWLVAWPILRRRRIRLAQLLGWLDLNLIAAIEHSILRPVIASPLPWTHAKALPSTSHRIRLSDPA